MKYEQNCLTKAKRILFCTNRDQFTPFDYKMNYKDAMAAIGYNSGNSVFWFSLQKMLSSSECVVDVDTDFWGNRPEFEKKIGCINESYDSIVICMANIFNAVANVHFLADYARIISKLKIPFNVVGVGAQGDKGYSFDFMTEIKDESYALVKAILNTGGGLGLRGDFTGEFIKKLGFRQDDFTVIGCPSMFMNGPDFKIQKANIKRKELKIAFNGSHFWTDEKFHKYFRDYSDSLFIAQDLFYKLLYKHDGLESVTNYEIQRGLFVKLFKEKRIKLYCDFPAWKDDLLKQGVNFSLGSRIHGNFAALMSGIPCFVDAIDSRVRELSDFFDIPNGYIENENYDLYEIYENIDYQKFNEGFKGKYNNFKKFMDKCGLPCHEDMKDTEAKIAKINYEIPKYGLTNEDFKYIVKKFVPKKRRFWYQFWHLYWLRPGKKNKECFY